MRGREDAVRSSDADDVEAASARAGSAWPEFDADVATAPSSQDPALLVALAADLEALDYTVDGVGALLGPAAYAALAAEGRADGTVLVDVPGGRLSVQISSSTTVLTGPAVIVSVGVLCPEWLAG